MRALWMTLFAIAGCARQQIPTFGELDADGDGRLAPAEVERSPELVELFSDVDADRDGQLSVGEYLVAVSQS